MKTPGVETAGLLPGISGIKDWEEIFAEIAFGDGAVDGEGLGPDAEGVGQSERKPADREWLPIRRSRQGRSGRAIRRARRSRVKRREAPAWVKTWRMSWSRLAIFEF